MVERGGTFSDAFETTATDCDIAGRTAWAWRGAGLDGFPEKPLGKWTLPYSQLDDEELEVLRDFFRARRGRYESFTLLDPFGNLVTRSEDFGHASWEKNSTSPGSATADPFGGNRATTITSSGGNANLVTTVIPDGDASGFVICGSVWVKAPAEQVLSIGFVDSGFTVLATRLWNLPSGAWCRISCASVLATNNYVRLLIGGLGTWAGQTLSLFGAQAVPLAGPAAYVRTPGRDGLRRKVRFDQDSLEVVTAGPNQHSTTITLVETF